MESVFVWGAVKSIGICLFIISNDSANQIVIATQNIRLRIDQELKSEFTIFANPAVGDRCPVLILDKYIWPSYRPMPSKKRSTVSPLLVYLQINHGSQQYQRWWQKCVLKQVSVEGEKTNHSLRVAGATTLFDAGVPERILQQRTGHKSVGGLRTYRIIGLLSACHC